MPPTSSHSPEAGPVLLAHLVAAPLPGVGDHRTEDATGFPAGGICTFEGITRPELHPDHGPLIALEYEAAEPLATHRLCELAKSIADRHELHRIEITHAIGAVPLGMPSVRIITAADHRDAAFTACREAIDRLKSEVPIWKRERWKQGSTWSESAIPLSESVKGTSP